MYFMYFTNQMCGQHKCNKHFFFLRVQDRGPQVRPLDKFNIYKSIASREKRQRPFDFFPTTCYAHQINNTSKANVFFNNYPLTAFNTHPTLSSNHTAKPTDLVTSLPFRYLADCVVGWVMHPA